MISAKRYIWDECSSSNDLSSRIEFPGGKTVMESILETKASTLLEFLAVG